MFQTQYLGRIFFALVVLKVVACFSTQYLGNAVHPTLENHCFYEEYNLTIPLGETQHPTDIEYECFKIHCRSDYVLEIKHCDRYPNYCIEKTDYDYSKPYPSCCPKIKCPKK
uniref:Single domain-containing protein n=1 Tax=Musca domestica TaxID=7370 RepID=A0A1I8N7R8_MUSDO